MNIWSLPNNEADSIRYLQNLGILPEYRDCDQGHPMKMCLTENRIVWRCFISTCRKRIGMRVGTWFEGSKLPFTTSIRFIYCWSEEMTSVLFCKKHLQISNVTAVDWNNYLREICAMDMSSGEKSKIGGVGLTVEVIECMFTKRKSTAGRILPPQSIFGGICRETDETFLVLVPNHSAETLLAEIRNNIEEGSTIFSDSWKGYRTEEIQKFGYVHCTGNHTYNFNNPDDGAHIQKIERLCGNANWKNKKHRGMAKHHLESYVAEFLWRKRHSKNASNPFDSILQAIARHFPPEKKSEYLNKNIDTQNTFTVFTPDIAS